MGWLNIKPVPAGLSGPHPPAGRPGARHPTASRGCHTHQAKEHGRQTRLPGLGLGPPALPAPMPASGHRRVAGTPPGAGEHWSGAAGWHGSCPPTPGAHFLRRPCPQAPAGTSGRASLTQAAVPRGSLPCLASQPHTQRTTRPRSAPAPLPPCLRLLICKMGRGQPLLVGLPGGPWECVGPEGPSSATGTRGPAG